MKEKLDEKIEMSLTPDEARLIRFFRCLSNETRSDCFYEIASKAFQECFPDKVITEVLFDGTDFSQYDHDEPHDYRNSLSVEHIFCSALEETGIEETLLGTSDSDEDEAIPRFVFGAKNASENQGNYQINIDKNLARTNIRGGREKIISACEKVRENISMIKD